MTSRLEPLHKLFPVAFPWHFLVQEQSNISGMVPSSTKFSEGKLSANSKKAVITQMRTMVLVYLTILTTKLGDFVRANVGKYSSTMEHMGQAS